MSGQQSIWKVFRDKVNKKHFLVILLVGVLLMVIALPTDKGTKEYINAAEYTEAEHRLQALLEELEGVGNVHVMITEADRGEVEGIAVVAEGAENAVVVRNITEIVQALFPVDSHKIKVIKGNQTN